jgi:hypothetical protein
VPVFPICIGEPPTGMIQTSHALCLDSDDDAELERRLTREAFDTMISWVARNSRPYFECAETPEERALYLADYADQVRSIDGPQFLRQSGGLSSFSIPDEPPRHQVWRHRVGTKPRPEFSHKCLRKERQALEEHAKAAGCRLLIHYGLKMDEEHGQGARHTRISTLIDFLESMPDDKIEIAMIEQSPRHSLILVDDWFVAESVTGDMQSGYRNTLFTRHAATVLHHRQEFDRMFDAHVRKGSGFLRADAVSKLRNELNNCPPPAQKSKVTELSM